MHPDTRYPRRAQADFPLTGQISPASSLGKGGSLRAYLRDKNGLYFESVSKSLICITFSLLYRLQPNGRRPHLICNPRLNAYRMTSLLRVAAAGQGELRSRWRWRDVPLACPSDPACDGHPRSRLARFALAWESLTCSICGRSAAAIHWRTEGLLRSWAFPRE
jgi:hypothetical protein